MTIDRALLCSILMAAIATSGAAPALPQAGTREGDAVTCDDGRRGLLSGESCHLARRHAIEPVAAFERDHRH
jgi:hypothetical protein